ncbi:Hint domain-containing protein [Salipiger sp. IMCC34102]|uniref:Hint domain-containing protein n=1 Tax=Salipiger sp. IMCC34102 TaxID=2510647 RepID=UPI00101D4D6E|nr:Hint domain-containing protein [Salipiger sp. IMCC34102]RYH03957.1 Hint domain-containing protein [Salipiger sp. IMCC34102]
MQQITNFDQTVTLNADLEVVNTNDLSLLNFIGPSRDVENISADDSDGLLENGDGVTVTSTDGDGDTVSRDGTYIGDATITTASVELNALLVGLNIQLNPIEGELIQYDDGSLGFISEDPLTDARLGVTADLTVAGITTTFEGDLSELDDFLDEQGVLGALLGNITDLTQYVLDTAVVTVDVDATGTLVVCFASGSMILTQAGETPVEALAVGDKVITRDHGAQSVRWIGRRNLSASVLEANPNLRPIRIRACAFGPGQPARDLMVSPQHRILVTSRIAERMFGSRDILVAAKQLLDLDGVEIATDVEEVEYIHFLLDQHEIVYSEWLATESLFTGPQALKSLSCEARFELLALFPELMRPDHLPASPVPLAPGKKARRLVERHRKNRKPVRSTGPDREVSPRPDVSAPVPT